jgi:SOS response regulatory protein OraA/RecX
LQSKGVSTEDIETLLGTEPQEDTHTDLEEVGQRAWSAVSTQPLWPQSNDIDIRRRHQSPQRYQK